MAQLPQALSTAGKSIAAAAVWVGSKTAQAYRKIDPDVGRHLAQLPLLSYSLLSPRRTTIERGKPDGHPPIVFVHGMGATRGSFLPMAGYLWLAGRKRGYRIDFAHQESIAAMAGALAEFVREVCLVNDEPEVQMVAHSLGGVVARVAIADCNLANCVQTLVTLGTPHAGTYAARYANTELTRDLRPDSELMQRLHRTPLPESVRGISLWSRNDLFVLPAESAALEGTEQIEMTPFTHYSYLLHPEAWTSVWRLLER